MAEFLKDFFGEVITSRVPNPKMEITFNADKSDVEIKSDFLKTIYGNNVSREANDEDFGYRKHNTIIIDGQTQKEIK